MSLIFSSENEAVQYLSDYTGNRIIIANRDWSKFKLVSSNKKKLKEFQEFGLPIEIESGKDLDEVDGNTEQVIIHKAKDAGPYKIVEDTSLEVEGSNVGINVRWLMRDIESMSGQKATWTVFLGVNDGESIAIYEGSITGKIIKPKDTPKNAFGFDPFFMPDGENKTLYELGSNKNKYSARKNAIDNLLSGKSTKKVNLNVIKKWEGKYQNHS